MIDSIFHHLKGFLYLALSASLISSQPAFAHHGHHHAAEIEKLKKSEGLVSVYRKIDEDYTHTVKPIFELKCAACHGSSSIQPWYYPIPGPRQLIDSDRAEAKEHLDFSKGFPFGGHGTPIEDLDAIAAVAKDESMPPFRYWVMHPGSRLNESDREAITDWARRSKSMLTSTPGNQN